MNYQTILISEPLHLLEAQKATRELSKAIGLDQVSVLNAVTAVNELANHLFIRTKKNGKLELAVIRQNERLCLEVKAESSPDGEKIPVTLVFQQPY